MRATYSLRQVCQQRHSDASSILTHSRVQKLLCRLIRAHVDGPRWNVPQQHWPKSSVQSADTILHPNDAGSPREALVYCARRPSVFPRTEGALRLQTGFDDIERAGDYARRNSSGRSTQGIHRPVWQFCDPHSKAGERRAQVGVPVRTRHVPGHVLDGCRRILVVSDSGGRRLGIVRGHGMGCNYIAIRVVAYDTWGEKASIQAVVPGCSASVCGAPQHSSYTMARNCPAPLTGGRTLDLCRS